MHLQTGQTNPGYISVEHLPSVSSASGLLSARFNFYISSEHYDTCCIHQCTTMPKKIAEIEVDEMKKRLYLPGLKLALQKMTRHMLILTVTQM